MRNPSSPSASASRQAHADWLEWLVISHPRHYISATTYGNLLQRGGSIEALDDGLGYTDAQEIDERIEAILDAVFRELDERVEACGGSEGPYPFQVSEGGLRYLPEDRSPLYSFLLLLSLFGHDSGPKGEDAAKYFEEVSCQAARAYLGGTSESVGYFVFGFPRRVGPAGFSKALDHLCTLVGEGIAHKNRPTTKDQKDAKLDVVAWRDFLDRQRGKLILFGQCATGQNWNDKFFPQPADWCKHWMRDPPPVDPVRALFVPHRIGTSAWLCECTFGGLLFERCRIASLASALEAELATKCSKWSEHVVKERGGFV